MAMRFLFLLLLVLLGVLPYAAHADPTGRYIIGWAGQSNDCDEGQGVFNENAGTVNDARLEQIGRWPWHTTSPKGLYGGASTNTYPNGFPVIAAAEPLDNWTRGGWHGSGMETMRYFARRLSLLPAGYNLLMVPGAHSGTSILYWNNVEPYTDTVSGQPADLNGDFMARMNAALTLPNVHIAFIKFDQVESDAGKMMRGDDPLMRTPQDYVYQLNILIASWRNQWGMVPVIWVPPTAGWMSTNPAWLDIKNQVTAAVRAQVGIIPKFGVVETDGHDGRTPLPDNSSVTGNARDAVHYSAEAQEFIALRAVYETYINVIGQ